MPSSSPRKYTLLREVSREKIGDPFVAGRSQLGRTFEAIHLSFGSVPELITNVRGETFKKFPIPASFTGISAKGDRTAGYLKNLEIDSAWHQGGDPDLLKL